METISVHDLKHVTETPLIDVREADEYAQGHVPGAINVPLSELPGRLDEITSLEVPVNVICAAGGRSMQAAEWLERQGVETTNVAEGTNGWIQAGYQVD